MFGPRTSIRLPRWRPVVAVLALALLCSPTPATATEIIEYPVPAPDGLLAAGPDGNVWFAMRAGSVGRISSAGTVSQLAFPPANLAGMTAGPDGAMWLSGKDATSSPFPATIYRVTMAGDVSTFTLGPDGALWFA